MRHLTVTIVLLFLTAIPLRSFGQTGATVTLLDSDGDGLTDAMEDTNGNGLVDTGETDPFDADTDGGGEADGAEVAAGRDPFDRKDDFTYDLDGDGLVNGEEWKLGTNPANPDSDNDGINDKDDPFPLNGAYRTDENENGIPDEYEESLQQAGAEPLQPSGDDDQDGLTNEQEFAANSDPFNADTDDDGVVDGMEVELGTDPTVNVCLLYGDAAVVFADLQDHWAEADVLALHRTFAESGSLRIVDGYRTASGALFLPDRSITRFELLKLALVSNCTAVTAQHDAENTVFSDVPYVLRRNASPAQLFRRNVIYSAARTGIIEGYPDGSVRPDDPVNRGEALKILLNASRIVPSEEDLPVQTFADVPDGAWFTPFVRTASALAVIEGYPDGTFRPAQFITRAEAAKIILFLIRTNPLINGDVIPADEE